VSFKKKKKKTPVGSGVENTKTGILNNKSKATQRIDALAIVVLYLLALYSFYTSLMDDVIMGSRDKPIRRRRSSSNSNSTGMVCVRKALKTIYTNASKGPEIIGYSSFLKQ
jgi:hypothetical protein